MIERLNAELKAARVAHSVKMLAPLLDELHAAEGELKVAKTKVLAIQETINLHRRVILEAKWGVAPGVLVSCRENMYRVLEVSPEAGSSKPWVTANLRKKDGEFSTRLSYLYSDWLIVK